MAAILFARDLTAFPIAWISGEGYTEVKKKALCFIRSAIRVSLAGGLIFAMYKWQYIYSDRKWWIIPLAPRLEITLARVPITLAPITLLANTVLIATAFSYPYLRMGLFGVWALLEIFNPANFQHNRPFFSATIIKETLRIDVFWILLNLAINTMPEVKLGSGLYLAAFGISQLRAFTFDRLSVEQASTELALKGIFHLMLGLECLGMYEQYSGRLEMKGTKKDTLIYKISDKLSPWLAWIATGR